MKPNSYRSRFLLCVIFGVNYGIAQIESCYIKADSIYINTSSKKYNFPANYPDYPFFSNRSSQIYFTKNNVYLCAEVTTDFWITGFRFIKYELKVDRLRPVDSFYYDYKTVTSVKCNFENHHLVFSQSLPKISLKIRIGLDTLTREGYNTTLDKLKAYLGAEQAHRGIKGVK